MAKRRRKNTIARQEKLQKEGRGKGKGKNFKPYTEIHDISSKGESMRSPSAKFGNGRIDHTLSRIETRVRRYELAPAVIDYRPQVQLNLDETLAIAKLCGLKHPAANGTPAVMVGDVEVDFLNQDGSISTRAYTIKPPSELNKTRVLEKFTIERIYYYIRDIPWGIITPKDIPKIPTDNLSFLKPYYNLNDNRINNELVVTVGEFTRPLVLTGEQTLKSVGEICDHEFALEKGISLKILLHIIARSYWKIDYQKPLKANGIPAIISAPRGIEDFISS